MRTWSWDGERPGDGEAGQGSRHRLEKAKVAAKIEKYWKECTNRRLRSENAMLRLRFQDLVQYGRH